MNEIEHYLGLTQNDAHTLAVMRRDSIRTVKKDGVPYICTRDFRGDRVNITVENNKVTKATWG